LSPTNRCAKKSYGVAKQRELLESVRAVGGSQPNYVEAEQMVSEADAWPGRIQWQR